MAADADVEVDDQAELHRPGIAGQAGHCEPPGFFKAGFFTLPLPSATPATLSETSWRLPIHSMNRLPRPAVAGAADFRSAPYRTSPPSSRPPGGGWDGRRAGREKI